MVQIVNKLTGEVVIEISFEEFVEFGLEDEINYRAIMKETGRHLT